MRRKKRAVLAGLAAFALVVFLGWRQLYPRISGVYLVEGGLGYIAVQPTWGGKHKITEPNWPPEMEQYADFCSTSIKAVRGGAELRVALTKKGRVDFGYAEGYDGFGSLYQLKPSGGASGDFDLNGFRYWDPYPKAPPGPIPTPIPVRCPSFLHRLDDPLVLEYFKAQRTENDPRRAHNAATKLLDAHPSDPHVRALYLEALVRRGDFKELESRLSLWRAEFLASENLYLKRIPALCDYVLASKALTENGKNAAVIMERLCKKVPDPPNPDRLECDLQTWLAEWPKIAACGGSMRLPTELNPARMGPGSDWLAVQIHAKVMATEAIFFAIQGRRAEALQTLMAGVYWGKWKAEDGVIINRLIGIAIECIHLHRLAIFALNACETEEELKAVADALDRVKDGPKTLVTADVARCASPLFPLVSGFTDTDEMGVRFSVAVATRQNLRGAVAARRRLLAKGAYPETDADFKPFLVGGLPEDPFGSAPLKHIADSGAFTVYSVGPDGDDDHAAIMYDPTNGSRSDGDILLRVPKEREFPFPREGTKAKTPEDLKTLYPNGLPADNFAQTRNRPLGVFPGPPVRIYSFGPDNDEIGYPPGIHKPEALYDPTNGLTSDGDLFIELGGPLDQAPSADSALREKTDLMEREYEVARTQSREAAIKQWRDFMRRHPGRPDEPEIELRIARLLELNIADPDSAGDPAAAYREVTGLLARRENSEADLREAMFFAANLAHVQDPPAVDSILRRLIDRYPGDAPTVLEAYCRRGHWASIERRYGEAEVFFRKVLAYKIEPNLEGEAYQQVAKAMGRSSVYLLELVSYHSDSPSQALQRLDALAKEFPHFPIFCNREWGEITEDLTDDVRGSPHKPRKPIVQ